MRISAVLLAGALLGAAGPTPRTFTLGVPSDLLTMDPDGANQTFTQVMLGSIYEGLVRLDEHMRVEPALASSWSQPSANMWRFNLRPGVHFHDGAALTAEDVVFSFARAAAEGSDIKVSVSPIRSVQAIDAQTVEIVTDGPDPILPREIPYVYIMSKAWAVAHQAEAPNGVRTERMTYATMHTNGTGPFRLVERTPDTSTTLERNPKWWDTTQTVLDRVVIRPIGSDATRIAALVAGDADLIQGVPLQAIDQLHNNPEIKVAEATDMRTLFLGMDQHSDHLPADPALPNPFKDVRVRRAVYQAIDIVAIQKRVMRGLSRPAGTMVAPSINGYDQGQDVRLPYDPAASRALLKEAGFSDGFTVTLDCPSGRLVNDEAICQALVPMLARVGIKVELNTRTFAQFSQAVLARKTSFYLQSWLPPSGDALNTLVSLMATPGDDRGTFNSGSYSNPKLDALLPKIRTELDTRKRDALIAEAMAIHAADIGHIPLHQQPVVWAMQQNVSVPVMPDDSVRLAWIHVSSR